MYDTHKQSMEEKFEGEKKKRKKKKREVWEKKKRKSREKKLKGWAKIWVGEKILGKKIWGEEKREGGVKIKNWEKACRKKKRDWREKRRKERRLSLFLANFGKRLPLLYFFFSLPIRQHQRLHWPVTLSSPSSWPNLLSTSIFQKAKLGSLAKIAAVAEERSKKI